MSSGIDQRKTYSDYSTYLKKRASNKRLNEAIKFYEKKPSTGVKTCSGWDSNSTEKLRKIRINFIRILLHEAMRVTQVPTLDTLTQLLDDKQYDIDTEGFINFINREFQVNLKIDPDISCLSNKILKDYDAETDKTDLLSVKQNRRQLLTAGDTYFAKKSEGSFTVLETVKVNSFNRTHILRGPVGPFSRGIINIST